MVKSQFNIKISKDLLVRVKRQAMMAGKSLTEHVTDLITSSLSESEVSIKVENSLISEGIKDIEKRLMDIEARVSNREYISKPLKPFSDNEASNCTRFMKSLFNMQVNKKNFADKNKAFDELLNHIHKYEYMDTPKSIFDRLRSVLLTDSTPFTGEELNLISGGDKCKCPIRKGLIGWTGITEFPSQQEICDKGDELLPL